MTNRCRTTALFVIFGVVCFAISSKAQQSTPGKGDASQQEHVVPRANGKLRHVPKPSASLETDRQLLLELQKDETADALLDATLDVDRLTVEMMESLSKHPKLTGLCLRFKSVETGADKMFVKFPELTDLWLEGPLSEGGFGQIAKLSHLKELFVELPTAMATISHDFSALKELKKVTMKGAPTSAEYFNAFANCPQLGRIELKAFKFPDAPDQELASLSSVAFVIINDDCEAPTLLFQWLSKMNSLERLTCDMKLRDEDLRTLAPCRTLKVVHCKEKPADEAITDFLSRSSEVERAVCASVDGVRFRYSMAGGKLVADELRPYIYINVGPIR